MQERRQSIRVKCELPTQFRNLDSDSPQPISNAIVVNVSRSGVCLRVDKFIPIQNRLYVYLNLPNQPMIEVRVTPAWIAELPHSGKYEIGARFAEIRSEDEEIIQNYQYQTLLEKMPRRKNYPQDL